ncbi:hypothetical protein C5C36_07905 [Rathayibacter sp. AY1G1]|uniref:tyrosine-type recombinase/integrase n=1 Tax=Rathayibacter sp. AY1G1 TaxID=2080564 RepID=UPI000CE84588|nr:site-specific integrase [Rathayibacter sp. AY1G1]PPH13454.1 hypothetical protein C5C36_07905 [Rathayibacter sp. AY1G1]
MAWTEQLPSGRFRGVYRLPDGKRRSAGTYVQEKQALKSAMAAEVDAAKLGWRDPDAAKRTWAAWSEEWWPTRSVEPGTLARDLSRRDGRLMPRWRDVALVDITRHDIRAWAVELAADGLAATTVQRCVHLLSASLTAAVDAQIITHNPAYRLRLPVGAQATERYLTRKKAAHLLDEFPKKSLDRALVSLLVGAGLRWGEAAGLQVNRVDLGRGVLRVVEVWDDKSRALKLYPKGRKVRDVPLPDWVVKRLRPLVAGRRSGYVFDVDGHVLDYSNWRRRVWLPALDASGIGATRIHDLRHTYASWLIQDGVSIEEVGRLLGHVSPMTTRKYAHLADTPRDAVLAALSEPTKRKKKPGRGADVGHEAATADIRPLRLVVDQSA